MTNEGEPKSELSLDVLLRHLGPARVKEEIERGRRIRRIREVLDKRDNELKQINQKKNG